MARIRLTKMQTALLAVTAIALLFFLCVLVATPHTSHKSLATSNVYTDINSNIIAVGREKSEAQSATVFYSLDGGSTKRSITSDTGISVSGHSTIRFYLRVSGGDKYSFNKETYPGSGSYYSSSEYARPYIDIRWAESSRYIPMHSDSSEDYRDIDIGSFQFIEKTFYIDVYYVQSSFGTTWIHFDDIYQCTYTVTLCRQSDLAASATASTSNVYATFSAGRGTYTLNGGSSQAYSSGTRLYGEGKYVVTNTLADGSYKQVTMYVDKTAPQITKPSDVIRTDGRVTWSVGPYESPVSATYTLNDGSPVAYSSGQALTADGKYTVTVSDSAGNSSSATFIKDTIPPTLSRAFEYGKNNGSVTWSVGAYESPVSATYTRNDGSPQAYSSGTVLNGEGKYTVTATDGAGNSSSATFIVDRTPPAIDRSTDTQYSRSDVSVSWRAPGVNESPITATYTHNGGSPQAYSSGTKYSAEGTYVFTVTDGAGNSSSETLYIDKTPPVITLSSSGYTKDPVTASAIDGFVGVDKLQVLVEGKWVDYDGTPGTDNGKYTFRATDFAGNSATAEVVKYSTDTFGNLARIRDTYKVNAWYTVTLPSRIFTTESKDIAGRYSFESYDKALTFASAKEREFRVTPVQGGFMYVSVSNESVAQKYETEQSLSAVVEKYAKGYVSARQTSNANGNDKLYVEPESLVRNIPVLPDYLLDYKYLPRLFARSSSTWILPNLSYIADMPYTVTAKYLGDFSEDITQREFVLQNNVPLREIEDYKQGWYLITESDAAYNTETYLIYSDAELPTIRATATFGNAERDLTIDYEYTQNETPYFLSLSLSALLDNADPYVTLKIEKNNNATYFTQSDELPVLGSEDYPADYPAGKYTITVFDRSLNVLTFDVYIAGAPPAMTHSSLAADKPECKLNFVTSDRYNVITGIELYKIEYDGSKTVLEVDGAGVPVDVATLSYTLTVGGKYGATVTDNYGRTVDIEPVFFLKGLPSGKLAGVSDGGRTNKNVSISFDGGDVCELFVLLPGGSRQTFGNYTVQTGSTQTTYNITADETTSHEYLVFLHSATDLSLFVEYTFEIDTIIPEFKITDSDGKAIQPDGATNKPFKIYWNETGVSVRYYTARSGSLGASKYNMNSVLSQGALYYFTLKDDVGNVAEFTVLLDNAVSYTINGNYNRVGGVLYASAPLTLTVTEPTQIFSVENVDGYTIDNGGTITQAGRYDITVTDNYGNTVEIAVVLDLTPPVITLSGVENDKSARTEVTVTASGHDMLYLADGKFNKLRDIISGDVFTDAGKYYVVASDYAGNTATASFAIDISVDYALSVPIGAVTTGKVVLETNEDLDISVTLDGERIDTASTFSDPGAYEIILTDVIGNAVSCVFIIIPARVREIDLMLPIGTHAVSMTRDGAGVDFKDPDVLSLRQSGAYTITLDCGGENFELVLEVDNTPPVATLERDGDSVTLAAVDKQNVLLELTRDGVEINCNVGKTFEDPGHYVLTATDELGNFSTYEFTIPYRLNTWAIVVIVVAGIALVVVIVLIIRARRKPRVK